MTVTRNPNMFSPDELETPYSYLATENKALQERNKYLEEALQKSQNEIYSLKITVDSLRMCLAQPSLF